MYLTAGAVYGLEGTLGDLEQCARSISSGTTDTELAFLEDQVATAAAQVQQSELQVPECSSPQTASVMTLVIPNLTPQLIVAVVLHCVSCFSGVKHRGQDIGSENSWLKCDCLQPLLQVQAKTEGNTLLVV